MAIWQTAGKVRMTPKGVYNSSTAYEILDIVSNADQTISYIAKQAVPAGTALTNTTYWTVIADVTEALENADAAISYIGDSYSSSSTYAVGDYVIHDGGLYRCKTAISTAEAWTAAHWEQVSAMDEVQDVKDEVSDLKSALHDESGMASTLNMNVYNENLLPGSNIWNGNWKTATTLINKWAPNGTYMGFVVMERTGTYNGIYQNVSVEANKKYTFEAFARVSAAQNVNIIVGNASSGDGTTATTNVKSKSFPLAANTWTRMVLTFSCSAAGVIAPRIENTASATIGVCGYVLYEGYPVTHVSDLIDSYPTVKATVDEFADMVYPMVNMLEEEEITAGEIYHRGTVTPEDNAGGKIISRLIPVTEGTTYYYRNVWAYFSTIKYFDGELVSLSSESITLASGSFTATKNGELAVTIGQSRTNANILLTTNETLYNNNTFATEYIPKKLKVPKVYHVEKDGSGDFDNLIEAITEAEKYMDSTVYVGPGTWDVVEEMGDAFENISQANRGIYLKNRIHLIFASDSEWVCNYTGTTASVIAWACIFNSGVYGFTLENATLKGSNIRYLVHDERDSDADSYINKYVNCRFELDNSESTATTHQCIGGGLGLCGYIEIDGCYFKSVIDTPKNVIFYHNSAAANGGAKSHICVKNCYAYGLGRFGFHWYGNSQLITEVEVSGCSYGAALHIGPETQTAPYENVHVTEWNNIVRT